MRTNKMKIRESEQEIERQTEESSGKVVTAYSRNSTTVRGAMRTREIFSTLRSEGIKGTLMTKVRMWNPTPDGTLSSRSFRCLFSASFSFLQEKTAPHRHGDAKKMILRHGHVQPFRARRRTVESVSLGSTLSLSLYGDERKISKSHRSVIRGREYITLEKTR